MRWLLPMAWVGAVAVAVPILVHLLSRDTAARYLFPSLRFLDRAMLEPARRTRLTDPWLLLVRCAIIVSAVAALARPLWTTTARERTLASWTARAVIVDTSASMAAQRVGTERVLDVARRRAAALGDSAQSALRIETAQPREAIAGAVQWLTQQGGLGELILVTDAQRSVVEADDLAAVPAEIGIRFVVVDGARDAFPPFVPAFPLRVVAVDSADVGADDPPLTRAQLELVRRIERDPLHPPTRRAVRAVGDTLEILTTSDAYAVAATQVMTARGVREPWSVFESDTARTPLDVLQRWEREASAATIARAFARDERSDARWLWLLVLCLLAVEAGLRRRVPITGEAR